VTDHLPAWGLAHQRPGAAAAVREGLAETLTVNRPGVTGSLLRTSESTNPVESMIAIVRDHATRVKRWESGEMALRWAAAGMLSAHGQFRRVRGFRELPLLAGSTPAGRSPARARGGRDRLSAVSFTRRPLAKFHDDWDILASRLMRDSDLQEWGRSGDPSEKGARARWRSRSVLVSMTWS
jgi:hypothetical protein